MSKRASEAETTPNMETLIDTAKHNLNQPDISNQLVVSHLSV
jgi:hypothetical protein